MAPLGCSLVFQVLSVRVIERLCFVKCGFVFKIILTVCEGLSYKKDGIAFGKFTLWEIILFLQAHIIKSVQGSYRLTRIF